MLNIEKKAEEYAKRYPDKATSSIARTAFIVGAVAYQEELRKAKERIIELKETVKWTASDALNALNE